MYLQFTVPPKKNQNTQFGSRLGEDCKFFFGGFPSPKKMRGITTVVWMTTTQERRGPGRDGRPQVRLCRHRSAAFLHPRRRLPDGWRLGPLPAASQCQRPALQRVLGVDGARTVRRHAVLVPAVCAGTRRQRPPVVVRRRRGVVETAVGLYARPLGSAWRPHPPLDHHTSRFDHTLRSATYRRPPCRVHHVSLQFHTHNTGPCRANLHKRGGCRPITFLWLWPATDQEPHCRHVPINRIWRRTEFTPRSGWWVRTHGWNLQRLQHSRNSSLIK